MTLLGLGFGLVPANDAGDDRDGQSQGQDDDADDHVFVVLLVLGLEFSITHVTELK